MASSGEGGDKRPGWGRRAPWATEPLGVPFGSPQGNGADLAPYGLGWGGFVTFLWKISAHPGAGTAVLRHPEPSAAHAVSSPAPPAETWRKAT